MIKPSIQNGRLHMPANVDRKYRWWLPEGQSMWQTLDELGITEMKQKKRLIQGYYLQQRLPEETYVQVTLDLTTQTVRIERYEKPPPADAVSVLKLLNGGNNHG